MTVGIALYNGRTKQLIGKQTVKFDAADAKFEYVQYDVLVAHLEEVAPALRN